MPLPPTRRALPTAALALVLVASVAACSDAGGSGGDSGGSGSSGDLSWEDSPMNELWESVGGASDMNQEDAQAQAEDENRKMEELVAQCMSDQGFEYNPTIYDAGTVISYGDDEGLQADTLEYAKQYGYGMSTWEDTPEGQSMSEGSSEEEYVDPNADIRAGMSETELAAWEEALWGAPQEPTYDEEGNETYEYSWEQGGCYGYAQNELYGGADEDLYAVYEDPQYAELMTRMEALYTTIDTNPEMQALTDSWINCMADAGYPDVATVEDGWNLVSQKLDALYTETNPDPSATDWAEPDAAAMQEIKDYEIAVATADYTCREELDYNDARLQIQFDLEQKFIDENKEALDAFIAAIQEAQGA